MPIHRAASFILATLAAACAGPTGFPHGGDRAATVAWAEARGFEAISVTTGDFRPFVLLRRVSATRSLVVYIEGDGAAWPSPWQPPRDPTPRMPMALLLANSDPALAVAWLARPCQYASAGETPCAATYWTDRRFSPEIVTAMNRALDELVKASGAERLALVGYSGGGVIATLLAGQRRDVAELLTVAAPLALIEWAASGGLSPLAGSLDPLSVQPLPASIHALHFAGGRDAVVPPAIVARYVDARGGRLLLEGSYDHECCWVLDWPVLLERVRRSASGPQ